MSLLKNSSIVIVGVLVANLLAFAFHFIAGRMLDPDDYGELGALMAIFLMVALPASALGSAITKFTSQYYTENQLGHIAVLRRKIQNDVFLLSGIILISFIFLSPFIAGYLKINSNMPVILVGFTLVFTFILPVNRGILLGMKKFRIYSWNAIMEAFSRVVLLVIFLYFGYGVSGAILAYGLAYLISFLLVFPYIKETRVAVTATEKIEFRSIYRYIFLVLIVNLLIQSFINLPSLFIKHYYSSEFTGYWTAALNIARISLFISGSISMVMFPEIAAAKDQQTKVDIFRKALMLVLVTSSGIALGFFVLPELCIHILYGAAYDDAVPILKFMGFAMIFMGVLQLWANYRLARLK